MIRTDAEYTAAQTQVAAARERLNSREAGLLAQGMAPEDFEFALEPVRTLFLGLEEDLACYERLKRGDLGQLKNLGGFGRFLVGLRVVSELTQRQLAERLDVHESQVSRDERHEYHGITMERASRIIDVLTSASDCQVVTHVVRRPNLKHEDATDGAPSADGLALAA